MFKNLKRIIPLILIVFLVVGTMSGCGKEQTPSTNIVVEENKEKTVTDILNRTVVIPSNVNKVYATDPVGKILIYTINPQKLAGLNYELTELEKRYTVEHFHKLPVLGGWFGKDNTGNIEEILTVSPDVIITMGDKMDESSKDFADELQEQIGIPVVVVDRNIENSHKSYEFLGQVLNEEKRSKELGDYCKEVIEEAKQIASEIKEEEKVSVYYAQGQDGLLTDPSGSTHSEILDLVGGKNIADVTLKGGYGRTEVSIEQILNWDPDKIIINKDKNYDANSYGIITTDTRWSSLKAVKENQVYEIPDAPFNWFDRPPSVNRIIGIRWLGNLLYPEKYDYDIEEEVKEFYEKFYSYKIKDGDLDEILINARHR